VDKGSEKKPRRQASVNSERELGRKCLTFSAAQVEEKYRTTQKVMTQNSQKRAKTQQKLTKTREKSEITFLSSPLMHSFRILAANKSP
jgi:hypothetical protein